MHSLQRRVILGGVIWAVFATLIGTLAVFYVFDRIADRRFNSVLEERHTQVVAALGTLQSVDGLEAFLTDPSYRRAYSGRYWQITGADGSVATSPSLFDVDLPVPEASPTSLELWSGDGPTGPVRGLRQLITLPDGTSWTVAVAASVSGLNAEREEMLRSVAYAFGFVGLLGIAAAALLTSVLVSPLRKLQSDVVNRWESGRALVPEDYPAEVAPLVADIDELLGRNREILHNGRRQAADLAHALKTPSASLRNELHALGAKSDETAPLFEALDRIDAQIKRSLARMRATTASYDVQAETDLGVAARRLERLFRALPESSDKVFDLDLEPDLVVALDAQDLEEILGNLLENAFKWCRTQVRLTVASDTAEVRISVEDDGPGIAASLRADALKGGARLDTSVPGTGLGLSITNDLVQAYGGSVELFRSGDLGGLGVRIRLPRGKPLGRGLASADRNRGPETPTPAPGCARVAPLRS